ncbi:MAG: hypothetical protein U9R39_10635 [Campylobacterota bacterium]|nr:hypothetical protein [Campylobacterota bacterium]
MYIEIEKNIENIKSQLKIDSDNFQLHHDIGLEYERLGDIDLALDSYGRALSIEPNCPDSLNAIKRLEKVR